ncbi:hypothetical protein L6452_02296 [Arctium lappa]|uniref:Uncharacterized protein n=1 Tax=Arctium lappa TaxID=4217 RepID=A0ACB9FK27_ARCLA|nr:hypothetical protein L6452_02296 [Arctium lappa]
MGVTPDATCDNGNDNVINTEEFGNQARKTNPDLPKESVQLQKETRVQQVNATIDHPYVPSQYWYSPRFIDSCDKTIERVTRVDATGAPSFSLDYSLMEGGKTQIQTTKTIKAEVGEGARRALNLEPSNEVVSETTSFKTLRGAMETLVAGLPIPVNVIDSWIFVLNDEEKYRSNESMRRIFFNTKVMLFFPMVHGYHYYLMVFNLKNPVVVIIGNNANDDEVENIYGSVLSNLILLSDINNHRPKVIEHSEKFNALSGGEKIEIYEVAHKTRGERLKPYKI